MARGGLEWTRRMSTHAPWAAAPISEADSASASASVSANTSLQVDAKRNGRLQDAMAMAIDCQSLPMTDNYCELMRAWRHKQCSGDEMRAVEGCDD